MDYSASSVAAGKCLNFIASRYLAMDYSAFSVAAEKCLNFVASRYLAVDYCVFQASCHNTLFASESCSVSVRGRKYNHML
jgi:hypothetical protein